MTDKNFDGTKFQKTVEDTWKSPMYMIEWENSYNLLRIANNLENISNGIEIMNQKLEKINICLKK